MLFKEKAHSAHWLPSRKKLLYTVANPARGLLNRERRIKEKSGSMCQSTDFSLDKSTYEEHLCVVVLTSSERGIQFHPLASYFLV